MTLADTLAAFLSDGWQIAADYLQDHDIPLPDVLLWYARLEEPEGPPTLLVGEYSGRVTGDAGRAQRIRWHRIASASTRVRPDHAPMRFWAVIYPADNGHHESGQGFVEPSRARRELKRRVLGQFPEIVVRWEEPCRLCTTRHGTVSVYTNALSCGMCEGRGAVTHCTAAPNLVPPEDSFSQSYE